MTCGCLAGGGGGGGAAAILVGDAGRGLVGIAVAVEAGFPGKGFGAANFESSFETLAPLWLGFFWCVAVVVVVVVVVVREEVFCFVEISRAAICRVTAPMEVMMRVSL